MQTKMYTKSNHTQERLWQWQPHDDHLIEALAENLNGCLNGVVSMVQRCVMIGLSRSLWRRARAQKCLSLSLSQRESLAASSWSRFNCEEPLRESLAVFWFQNLLTQTYKTVCMCVQLKAHSAVNCSMIVWKLIGRLWLSWHDSSHYRMVWTV